jgi:putative secretion ATPase (PEP-CTERM system associated)
MYKNFYNLSQNPFQLNANLEFFFNSAGHKRAKAYLRYGLIQGEGFVVVTGEPGTGKTMLVKELFESFKQDEDIVIGLMVTSQVGAEDTLRMLSSAFNVAYESNDNKAVLLVRLENFFRENAQLGKRVLLVVDEAQNLPKQSIEELRMLSNYEWEGKVIFQIFLVGQEELGKLLYSSGMDQVKQRIVATYHLKAIEEDEIKQYILFRLAKAGWKSNPEFEEDIFSEIYRYTKGIPRRINTLCDRLLLFGYLEERSVIDLESTRHVISEIEADYDSLNIEKETAIEKIESTDDLTKNQRIIALEQKVADLSNSLHKEKILLRKAILIHLDMDDAYPED